MSTLIVHECDPTEVYQEITPTKNMLMNSIRPHIYIHGAPAGDVEVRITDSSGFQISTSGATSIATLKANIEAVVGAGSYIHAYPTIELKTPLRSGVTYRIYLTCSNGYSFSESAYVGICKDWDNTKVSSTYSPSAGFSSPLDFEHWERKNI